MNTYGYAVYRNANIPLHIVEIRHCMLAAFDVFNTAQDAQRYINEAKETLSSYGELKYDSDFKFTHGLLSLYINAKFGLCSNIDNREVYITYL